MGYLCMIHHLWLILLVVLPSAVGASESAFEIRRVLEPGQAEAVESEGPAEKLLLEKSPSLTTRDVARAGIISEPDGRLALVIKFNEAGTEVFSRLTSSLQKKLAILIDGKLQSAPLVLAPITDGEVVVSGNFSEEEAKAIAQRINADLPRASQRLQYLKQIRAVWSLVFWGTAHYAP